MLVEVSSTTNGWALSRASVDHLIHAIASGRNDALASYLGVMARFHTYSARNVLLIAAQRPTATHLEGVRSWRELGRSVRPGEKGIFIFAPALGIKDKTDSKAEDSGTKPAKRKKTAGATNEPAQQETQLLGFRGVYVFDIAQTGGESLTQSRLSVNVAEGLQTLTAFAHAQGMKMEYADWIAPAKATSYRGIIRLLPNQECAESFVAFLRELASQMLYGIKRQTSVTRYLHQQETKAAAFVVCEALELKARTDSVDCQLYHGNARLLAESLHVVHRTAAAILRAFNTENATASQAAQGVQ